MSDSIEQQLQEIYTYYQGQKDNNSQENLVSLLKEIQELYSCIPADVLLQVSEIFQVKPALLKNLIKLYPSLRDCDCRHRIVLCMGASCSQKQAQNLLQTLKAYVENRPFQLTTQTCLKQCSTAPNMRVNQDFYPHVKADQIPHILEQYQ